MNKYNNEGLSDPTAYFGMKEIVKEESEQERKNSEHLMHILSGKLHTWQDLKWRKNHLQDKKQERNSNK